MEQGNKARILVIDDEPTNVQVLGNLLKNDYRIQVATNGDKGLTLAQKEPRPDLILLDVQMPELDGYEVCRLLKENPNTKTIPVIFVTARDTAGDEEKGLSLGAVDYISKPFHPKLVRARVAIHMSLKKKTDLLEEIAMYDGLTSIPNRRSFDERLKEESLRSRRNGKPLAIIMMDIDHFKNFNDNYGHGEGDECLRKVAREISHTLARPADMVARYGGEEFVVLLPETDCAGAKKVAEEVRSAVEALKIPHEYSSVADVVTISLGVASSEFRDPTTSKENLLKRADDALYQSKENGRNRVTTA
ncbi:MAG: diguanylate cyclase [Thermodesulfobacteriota bacterium]